MLGARDTDEFEANMSLSYGANNLGEDTEEERCHSGNYWSFHFCHLFFNFFNTLVLKVSFISEVK